MKKSPFSLKRLSTLFLVLGVIASGLSLGMTWGIGSSETYAELIDILNVAGLTLIGLGLVAGAIAIRDQIYGFSKTRQARSGANALLISFLFIGIF